VEATLFLKLLTLEQKQHDMTLKSLQYSLQSIRKLTSYLNSIDTLPITNLGDELIGVGKGFQFGFDQTKGIFTIRVQTDFMCRAETDAPIKLFGTTIQCDFLFKDYEEILNESQDQRIEIPDDLMLTLMSVSFSSARGILAELTAGTDYQNIYLPLVSIQDFKTMLKSLENKEEAK